MKVEPWLMVSVLAIASTALAMVGSIDDETRTIASLFGALSWAVWAFGAMSLETSTTCCGTETSEYLSLAALGAGASMILLLVFVQSALSLLSDEPPVEPTAP